MVVQHNLQAMNANRMLGVTQKSVSGSTEKLSSGYRINRAADDAAGLSISEKMRKQIRGLDQASANAEDGISCVQTAEGALAEVQDMLQRMNELCVQAANGTNSETDRQYIQDEIDQLISEVDRVSETTKFNEIYLLKGDKEVGTYKSYVTNYSVTYTLNDTSNAVTDATKYKVNYTGSNTVYMVDKDVLNVDSSVKHTAESVKNGDDITQYMIDGGTDNTAEAQMSTSYVAFVNVELNSAVAAADPNQTAESGLGGLTDSQNTKKIDLAYDTTSSVVKASRDLYIYDTKQQTITHIARGTDMTDYLKDDNTMEDHLRLVDILSDGSNSGETSKRVKDTITNNADFDWTDKYIEIDTTEKQLYDADGNKVSGMALHKYFDEHGAYKGGLYMTAQARAIDEVFANADSPEYLLLKDKDGNQAGGVITDYINQSFTEVAEKLEFDLHVGADSDRTNKITTGIDSISSAGLGIDKLASYNIGIVDTTGDNATDAIDVIAAALQKVSTQRSSLGAVQNRLDHTIKNLDNIVENTTAAESAIRDTDMAEEMVAYSNNNVLQQAGQSMLAQANQANQGILSLLQ